MAMFETSQKKHIPSATLVLALCISVAMAIGRTAVCSPVNTAWPGTDTQESREFDDLLKTLQGDDSYERHRAAIALGRSGNPQAVDPLIKALADQDLFVRSFAATALGNLGDRRAVAPLIQALADTDMIVRRAAVTALGILKDADAVDPLIQKLDDENFLVRRAAAEALGDLGDSRAVDPLLKALGHPDSYISNGAAIGLSKIGSAGIPKLVTALGDRVSGPKAAEILQGLNWQPASDEERVRFNAARQDIQALLRNWDVVRKVLLSDADHGNALQVENAVHALIGIGQDEVLDELNRILRTKGSVEMAEAFVNSGNVRLSKIADAWAKEHGTEIKADNNADALRWGSWRSDEEL